ncbi:MAG: 50S ribosomal protein L10 [Candidatus Aceula lacicola]|nr:50S ribosomal protein L10 [Candidatus Aceula lacicola]
MKKVGLLIREGIINRISKGVKERQNTFLISYSKVSSPEMSDFRKALSQTGAEIYVSKNRIAQRALKDLDISELGEKIENQIAFVWSDKDSVEVAKVLVKFAKDFEGLNVQGGVLEGKAVAESEIQRLSDLPSRDVLLTMLAQTIQAPLTRLAGALTGKTRDLLSILKQLSEKIGGK